ncbi:acyltransferase family protein [Desulfitobacterium sp. PCE1]|uniref:acyltransferase family protein n=1 Tax=Desulfitobacterium sp. PCE1 TaxID=146907 RepID=UPI0004888278|nr:acyltransferase family protein [Desulfitobacterium sp. PCE1]
MNCSTKTNQLYEQPNRPQRGRRVRAHSCGYMPGLDGLRALAVFAVIAYHLNVSWAPGGLLGVTLFFVLSGYLITNILLKQWDGTGRIDLKDFWLRRARRLLPAVFVMLAGVMLWMMLWAPERLAALKGEVLAAVFYISNWYLIFHQVSYFESFGPPSPLGHLWSLAVEEQFYVIWPLLLGLGLSRIRRRKWLTMGTIAVTLASAAAMALIYIPGQDPSRIYYGTDTRAFSLLVGAVLAMVWPSGKMAGELSGSKRWVLDGAGILGLLVVLLMIGKTNQYQAFLYQGGLLLFSVAAAILVAVLAHPSSFLGRFFSWGPLRWLGECSYGIYLWHYPVIILTNPVVNTGGLDLSRTLWQIGLSIILAALSRYFIEDPIRYGRRRRGRRRTPVLQWWQRPLCAGAKISLSIMLMTVLLFITPACVADNSGNEGAGISAKAITENHEATEQTQTQNQNENANENANENVNKQEDETQETEQKDNAVKGDAAGNDITVIGDSVMINVEPVLQERLKGVVVDAQLGRQMYQAPEVIAGLQKEGKLGKTVIIQLGTNGSFSEKQLKQTLDSLQGSPEILLINSRVPKPWEGEVNETLKRVAQTYPKTKLIDWYSTSKGHNDYFYSDGVHLTQAGVEAYGEMLINALSPK